MVVLLAGLIKFLKFIKSWFPKKFGTDQQPLWPSIMTTRRATARFLKITTGRCFFEIASMVGLSAVAVMVCRSCFLEHHKEITKDRHTWISDLFFGTSGVAGCRDSECTKKKTRTSVAESYESAAIRFVFGTRWAAGCRDRNVQNGLVRVGKYP
jgi:hypothetical protein